MFYCFVASRSGVRPCHVICCCRVEQRYLCFYGFLVIVFWCDWRLTCCWKNIRTGHLIVRTCFMVLLCLFPLAFWLGVYLCFSGFLVIVFGCDWLLTCCWRKYPYRALDRADMFYGFVVFYFLEPFAAVPCYLLLPEFGSVCVAVLSLFCSDVNNFWGMFGLFGVLHLRCMVFWLSCFDVIVDILAVPCYLLLPEFGSVCVAVLQWP